MKRILIAASVIALFSMPAQAQILGGGGGFGGGLGGALGGVGTFGPLASLPSTSGFPDDPLGGTFGATGNGSASGNGSAHVDRHKGHVDASGNGATNGTGGAKGAITGPLGATGSGNANGSASSGGSASADLIGTDAVRSTAQGAVAGARSTAQSARGAGDNLVGSVRSTASNVAGSASGSATGAASYGNGALAAAGSAAAAGQGAFSVEKGMSVLDASGDKIGKVQQVVANGQGQVQSLLVKVDGAKAMLPANNFQASGKGNALVSAMGEGAIKQTAQQQGSSAQ